MGRKLLNGGNASSCVPCLLSALSVSVGRWPDQQTRRACVASGEKGREGRNGDFCDEIGVPGEHCLGQETAAITGEKGRAREGGGQDEKRQQAPYDSDVSSSS